MVKLSEDRSDAGNRSVRELNIITKVSQSIIRTLNMNQVLQIISDGMAELLAIESSAIYLIDGTELLLSATTPPLPTDMPDFAKKADISAHPHIEKTIAKKRAQIISDTHTETLTPAEKEIVEVRQLKSIVYLPFVVQTKVLGVLILCTCSKERIFTAYDIELGQTVANQLAVAIQNAQMHQNLENLVQEKTKNLDTAIEELRAMNEELHNKNQLIKNKNNDLENTLLNLKEAQAQLLQAEKMASLGTLTAGIAHEINNPLNFIQAGSFGLESYFEEHGNRSETTNKYLSIIKEGINRSTKIIQGLNLFSRETDSMTETCDIHETIENCLSMLNAQLDGKIEVTKKFTVANVDLIGNIGKMHQAFMNVLNNAVQAIAETGSISITTSVETGNIITTITDSGQGIAPEILHQITDPFFTTKDPGIGTGLGLSITYKIIKDHGGLLRFQSEEGVGTAVTIILPHKA